MGLRLTQRDRNAFEKNKRKGTYEAFTFPITDYRAEHHELLRTADIVHLHWVADFINYPTFFATIKRPIVWTFHDMNPLLGGFHYQGDKDRNMNAFGDLEQKLERIKRSAYEATGNMTVVTPSRWLGNCVQGHDQLKRMPFRNIPYGLDLNVFKPHNKALARSVFNLPDDKKIILFVSDRIDYDRKGFDLLKAAMEQIHLGSDFLMVTIGSNGATGLEKSDRIVPLGRIGDDRLMSLLFSAADVFVLPSREDNFPNVMLESRACGTPVLAFPVGGMTDVIRNGFNGWLADNVSVVALRNMIEKFMMGEMNFESAAIRDFAVDNFALSIQAKKYFDLYSEILSASARP
jgi:glycosyltransferase involved in cell wall biosynthesis